MCARGHKLLPTSIPTANIKLLPVSENGAAILEFCFRFRFWPMCCDFASACQISS